MTQTNIKKIILFSILLLITFLSLYFRFWNYKKFVNFHLDPPAHIMDVKDIVESKRTFLLGPIVASKEVLGRYFFTGPFQYWFIAFWAILSGWNIVFISKIYTLLWFAFFLTLFIILAVDFDLTIALVFYAFFSFIPKFIPISKSIWNPHFLPLFGLLMLWFLVKRRRHKLLYFLSGLFLGLGINVHYAAIMWVLLPIIFMTEDVRSKKFKLSNWAIFVVGIIIAELPFIIFELRNNFYNLNTFIFQLKYGRLTAGYGFNASYYFTFPAVPVVAYYLPKVIYRLKGSAFYKLMLVLISIITVYFVYIDFNRLDSSYTYPRGWSIDKQLEVRDLILEDGEKNFEVAELVNSDTRALDLRWWLREKGAKVMGVEEYDKATVLYLVAPEDRPPESENVWEVSTLRPFNVELRKDLGDNLYFYKLVKSE